MDVTIPIQRRQDNIEIVSESTTNFRTTGYGLENRPYILIAWMNAKNNYGAFETEVRNNTEIRIGRLSNLERKLLESVKNASPIRKDEMYILIYNGNELKVAIPMDVYDNHVKEKHLVIKPKIEGEKITMEMYANGLTGIGGRYLVEDPNKIWKGKPSLLASPIDVIVLSGPDPCFYAQKGGKLIANLSNNEAILLVFNPCSKNYRNVLVAVYSREGNIKNNTTF